MQFEVRRYGQHAAATAIKLALSQYLHDLRTAATTVYDTILLRAIMQINYIKVEGMGNMHPDRPTGDLKVRTPNL
jgi:pseudouridine-5'-phosphate glycosidase